MNLPGISGAVTSFAIMFADSPAASSGRPKAAARASVLPTPLTETSRQPNGQATEPVFLIFQILLKTAPGATAVPSSKVTSWKAQVQLIVTISATRMLTSTHVALSISSLASMTTGLHSSTGSSVLTGFSTSVSSSLTTLA